MGTWGSKTFENDAAADWLYDLEEATNAGFVLKPLKAVLRSNGKADIDDSLEALAAAEVLAGARYDPPKNIPHIARSWVKRVACVPNNAELKLANRAVEKIGKHSELADGWQAEGKLAPWRAELKKLSARLKAALRVALPVRQIKPKVQRETIAELIIAAATDPAGARRGELQKKLAKLSNPDRPVGGKLDGQTLSRLAPLHWVAARGMIPEAQLLLARGANVNLKIFLHGSAMDYAIAKDQIEMVKLLLAAGANRQEALLAALGDDRVEIVRLIVDHGANVNEVLADGKWTPLMWAAESGSVGSLQLLLTLGAQVNCVHENGDTPLHFAANGPVTYSDSAKRARFLPAVKLLVEHGAKLNVPGYEGKTPLDVAEAAASETTVAKEIVRFLRRRGARNGKVKLA